MAGRARRCRELKFAVPSMMERSIDMANQMATTQMMARNSMIQPDARESDTRSTGIIEPAL
jgi:hypothetical protein